MQILDRLDEHAAQRPESPAARSVHAGLVDTLTYGELRSAAASLAARLREWTNPDDAVALSACNCPEFLIAVLATLGAARTIFPLHPKLTATERLAAVARAGVRVMIGEGEALAAAPGLGLRALSIGELRRLPPARAWTRPGVPGLMLQSSGTTGLPKIVRRSGPSLDAVARNVAGACELTPDDRVLGIVPLGHSYGIENGLLGPVWAGSCVEVTEGFDMPDLLARLRSAEGPTVFPASPFMLDMLGRLSDSTKTPLRLVYSAGATLPGEVAAGFQGKFGVRVGQLYGASEIGSVTFNHPGAGPHAPSGYDPSSVGSAMDGVRLLVTAPSGRESPAGQEGEILVHAPSMMDGYADEPARPFREVDGVPFFPTGDLGRLAHDGQLRVTGRIKLLIDIGGLKVNPLEVEQVLARHQDVGHCVVLGVELSRTVSRVKAIVTPRRPGGRVDVESVRAHARASLAGFKVPRVFEVREALPLSPMGKVLRWKLGSESGAE